MKMQLCPLNVIFAHEFLTFIFILSVLQLLDSRSPISQAAAQKMAIISIYIYISIFPFLNQKNQRHLIVTAYMQTFDSTSFDPT